MVTVHHETDQMRSKGALIFGVALAAIAILPLSFLLKSGDDRGFVKTISEKLPDMAKIFEQGMEAKIRHWSGLSAIEQNELQNTTSKQQGDNSKEQLAGVLHTAMQAFRSTAAGG